MKKSISSDALECKKTKQMKENGVQKRQIEKSKYEPLHKILHFL